MVNHIEPQEPVVAATDGKTVSVPIEEYGAGSYLQREAAQTLLAVEPRLHSINLALE